ncbi:TNT domain-containing protein [Thermoanaerobacter sp. A7A]|uniref:TNT domain-containing protein n=1 Tax=Thermoanaerobacter sp. A7A TaxID=1350366 RepID=UPI000429A97A|nr:TNT domain-containing protein [Thermoanaerobacter sp. A7A]
MKKVFKPGERFDRYGYEKTGKFAAPVGTPFEMRSLPPENRKLPYNIYEVIKPFEALEGKTAPWFDQPGGSIQYKMPKTIKELINEGYIREVKVK